MGRISPNRIEKALQNFDEDQIWDVMEALEKRLSEYDPKRLEDMFGTPVYRLASIISKKREDKVEPYNEGRHNLRYLIDICDAFVIDLPKKQLKERLNAAFEKELSGTWYSLLSAAAGNDMDLRQTNPDIAEGVDARLKGLHELIHYDNREPLREIVKKKLNFDDLPKFGRDSKPTALTAYILRETKQLKSLHSLRTRGEQIQFFKKHLEKFPDVQRWKANPTTTLPRDASQELLAYQTFHGKTSSEAGEILRTMERNNPTFEG